MAYNELRKGRVSTAERIYFVTTITHLRTPWFTDLVIARQVVQEMRLLHEDKALESLAWVLMPDHLHWLFALGEKMSIGEVMKRFKGRSARRVNQHCDHNGSVWQKAYYDHALREEEDLREVARYIVANPLRAGLASNIGDYPLWDAIWL